MRPPPAHLGERFPARRSGVARRAWRHHGLSIVLLSLFLMTICGQTLTGWRVYNVERQLHHDDPVSLVAYVRTGHFGEATFENWESEFLQLTFYVLLTVALYQRGSSKSKRPHVVEKVDLDPRDAPNKDAAPWPVRCGGFVLVIYENSLSLAFGVLFGLSFLAHARTGIVLYNQEQAAHGQATASLSEYVGSARFWFESFQNWQSEFLSLAAMVVFTIFLRQRGSPESKPVEAPTWDTGI